MNDTETNFKEMLKQASQLQKDRNNIPEAEKIYLQILNKDDKNYSALVSLATLYRNVGQLDKAIFCANKAVNLYPQNAPALHLLGIILVAKRDFNNAIICLKKAIEINKEITDGHYYLGLCYQLSNNEEISKQCYKKAIEAAPNDVKAYHNLGCIYFWNNDIEQAAQLFEKANSLNDSFTEVDHNMAYIETIRGNYDKAIEYYEKILKVDPHYGEAYHGIASIKTYSDPQDPDFDRINQALSAGPNNADNKSCLHFALGKMYNDLQNFELAFDHYQQANKLFESTLRNTRHILLDNISAGESFFYNEQFFTDRSGYGSQSTKPIFIVGQPRSGTSLLGQIISSHSQVNNAGELKKIHKIIKSLFDKYISQTKYPDFIEHLSKHDILNFANDYLKELQSNTPAAKHIIDKMPDNYVHIGLIKLMFPQAKIIHCRRHPIDTCLSMYFQKFNTDEMNFAFNLDILAKYYKIYKHVMNEYHKILPDFIHDIKYEDLISDPQTQITSLLQFCDLEWEDSCLNYQNNKQSIVTASAWQARQPMYKSSMDRWKNYEKFIQPLIKSLADEIAEYEKQ